jgi:deoxyadenosine/deoxycytidine kinase
MLKNLLLKRLKINYREMSTKKSKNLTTIVVEGNIGSGKTTFLEHFSNMSQSTQRQTEVLSEPIEKWRNVRGINLFELLYEDINRWCFPFQSYVQLSMLELHQKEPKTNDISIKLMERSIYSARYCFVENLFRTNRLKPEEYNILDEWFKYIVNNEHNVSVDLIIYLKTDPEVVYQRIKKRGRNEEKNITLNYLKCLHELHEQWLYKKSEFAIPAPVLTIDANSDLEQVKLLYDKHSQNILNANERNFCI